MYYTSNGVNWGAPLTAANRRVRPRPIKTINSQVKVERRSQVRVLPPTLQDIFVVDIPLMPPIDLTGATINGVFRCEGN